MQVQSTSIQESKYTSKASKINTEFNVDEVNLSLDALLKDEKYKSYEQYMKNSIKLSMHTFDTNYEDALKSVKGIIDNPDFPGNNAYSSTFIPNGGPLSNELTNTLIQTHDKLGDDKFSLMMLMLTADHSSPKPDDSRYFNENGTVKNDPNYPIGQYNKDKFENNNKMLDLLQTILQDLIDGAKKYGGDISVAKNVYETLINSFIQEITKSQDENNAQLESITKNDRPNPLDKINI